MATRKRVLITGAAGRIGSSLADQLHDRYDLRLQYNRSPIVNPPVSDVVQADIAHYDQVMPLMAGIDAVVHMAGEPSVGAPWASIHEANIVGMYNVIEA
ncbi:MAG: NAD(P)-dependent oxidoreductase, partial [Chloroflexi bacterium]|nr:NAD(P)-dependent oxidoreductase [Chloroflexota bacterium]